MVNMLAKRIHQLVADMPQELVHELILILRRGREGDWSQLRGIVAHSMPSPSIRREALAFLHYWETTHPQVGISAVALAMSTAAQVIEHQRQTQQLEIVWTGPDSQVISMRRNDRALLELIHAAQATLHIVSFAVYKADDIISAIVQAAERGVSISIYLETPAESSGKMTIDTMKALGSEVVKRVKVYVWPQKKRPLNREGRFGSLHAKLALADGQQLLISSANLTDYAMTLNMEIGVLIRGGNQPQQVERHLLRLIEQGDFVLVPSSR